MTTDARAAERAAFLAAAGWADAEARPLAGDASTRSYERLTLNGRPAVLMNAPPKAEAAACPPDASPQERAALGYNALARLAGPNLNAFTAIANVLRAAGLSAPEIYAADADTGFALIEDLGDELFSRALGHGVSEPDLYAAAVAVQLRLHEADAAQTLRGNDAPYRLLDYDALALSTEIDLVLDWYWPHAKGAPAPDDARAAFHAAWRAPLALTMQGPRALTLRDYHADNLIWLPTRAGPAKAGLLDFQDALCGHPAYDLASLLDDVRRDVTPALAATLLDAYAAEAAETVAGFDADAFRAGYAVLAAQRNSKILGIFARLANRDGKRRYLDYHPKAAANLRGNLAHPALAEVRAWYAANLPEILEAQ